MHLTPLHPQQLLLLGALTTLLALFVLAVAASDLSTLDLSLGGGGADAAPEASAATTSAGWTAEPLPAPVDLLRGR